ncbi:MAG: hypothetical protein KA976_06635 [Paludibacteraceae bacterium]|jgi:hypothetical protein|nr:hypothetical protein [Paludibacteraceae bacterium]
MKTVIKILLSLSIVLLSYLCVASIITPIRFERIKNQREKDVIQCLVDIRKAQIEFKDQNKRYTASFDTLFHFLKTAKKKIVMKEGFLTDKQLEAGLTEAKAAEIVRKGNQKEIAEYGLQNFRRDTILTDLLEEVFPNYNRDNIDKMRIIPYSKNEEFTLKVNNNYTNISGIRIPLFEASALYESYLYDLNRQELLNLIDRTLKMGKFPGLKVGSIEEPNNNAGNWE